MAIFYKAWFFSLFIQQFQDLSFIGSECVAGDPAVGHAVVAQAIQFGQAQLQGMKAKDIGHGRVDTLLLPGQHQTACGGLQPGPQLYNRLLSRHESLIAARLRRQLHLDVA